MDTQSAGREPLLRAVDAVMLSVPDLDAGIAFYRDQLGHRLRWRNDELGQAAVACPESATEIVLSELHRSTSRSGGSPSQRTRSATGWS